MTREDAIKEVNSAYVGTAKEHFYLILINKIYDDFEEELKKAYVEGTKDVWKALNCKELAK